MTECIECMSPLSVPQDVMEGEILPCPDCGAELEVRSVDPLSLAPAPAVMEDWGE